MIQTETEMLSCCNSIAVNQIVTKFCSNHDSTAVVACAKFCTAHIFQKKIWDQNKIRIKFVLRWITPQWNGPLVAISTWYPIMGPHKWGPHLTCSTMPLPLKVIYSGGQLPYYWEACKLHNKDLWLTFQHIEAKTKWTPWCRRHFETHFLEWKCSACD